MLPDFVSVPPLDQHNVTDEVRFLLIDGPDDHLTSLTMDILQHIRENRMSFQAASSLGQSCHRRGLHSVSELVGSTA